MVKGRRIARIARGRGIRSRMLLMDVADQRWDVEAGDCTLVDVNTAQRCVVDL